ncbi:MAG: Zn-ribbon containing protein [Candidatus Pacearchaeota archaeon]
MPYECVRCGRIYEESNVILKGCKCGSKFFYFFKEKPKEEIINLTQEEVKEIEKEIKEIIKIPEETPVILDLESIRAIKPGKFEIDLVKLFKKNPIIFKIEEGKYIIDLASTFELMRK